MIPGKGKQVDKDFLKVQYRQHLSQPATPSKGVALVRDVPKHRKSAEEMRDEQRKEMKRRGIPCLSEDPDLAPTKFERINAPINPARCHSKTSTLPWKKLGEKRSPVVSTNSSSTVSCNSDTSPSVQPEKQEDLIKNHEHEHRKKRLREALDPNLVAAENSDERLCKDKAFEAIDSVAIETVAACPAEQLARDKEKLAKAVQEIEDDVTPNAASTALIILEEAHKKKSFEKLMTKEENEQLAKFFGGMAAYNDKIMGLINKTLDKIFDDVQKKIEPQKLPEPHFFLNREMAKKAFFDAIFAHPEYLPDSWKTNFQRWREDAMREHYGINVWKVLFTYPRQRRFGDSEVNADGSFTPKPRGLLMGILLSPRDQRSFEETAHRAKESTEHSTINPQIIQTMVSQGRRLVKSHAASFAYSKNTMLSSRNGKLISIAKLQQKAVDEIYAPTNKRGNSSKSSKKQGNKWPLPTWMIVLFVFVVCGSAIFEVVRNVKIMLHN
ncbi:unnamed protein product, partial [Mesorhabditis belari]|uniref:Uncharacterized protein n=1 Tax=Mesorhabditis belari TaxID=2138241 RepID=A0AAF3EL46_9BILA